MTTEELRTILAQARAGGGGMLCLSPRALAEITADALRFRYIRKTIGLGPSNSGGTDLFVGFIAKVPPVSFQSAEDMDDAWTAAIDAAMTTEQNPR